MHMPLELNEAEAQQPFDEESLTNIFGLIEILKKISARLQSEGVDLQKAKALFDANPTLSPKEIIEQASSEK
jgi:hypothetical protein